MKRTNNTKKVGATVVPNAYNYMNPYNNGLVNPILAEEAAFGYGLNPYNNGLVNPILAQEAAFGLGNPYVNPILAQEAAFGYGMSPFFPPFPPVPPPIPPYVYDSRLDDCRRHDRDNIGVAASILPQNISQGTTQTLVLGSELFSRGGAKLRGNSLEGTRRGVYNVDFSVTCKRSAMSNPGIVNFYLSGSFTGTTGVVAGGTLESNSEITFTGSANVNMTSHDGTVSLSISNLTAGAGTVEVTGGRISLAKE